jgi:hypothetical protein
MIEPTTNKSGFNEQSGRKVEPPKNYVFGDMCPEKGLSVMLLDKYGGLNGLIWINVIYGVGHGQHDQPNAFDWMVQLDFQIGSGVRLFQ